MMRVLLLCLAACFVLPVFAQPKYEFRGVWIATVDNIDWPRRGVTDIESQKADFIRQLELHRRNGMNAVIVQVRPAADAFYPSPYEPWSQWLTGVQGKAPSPYYDPLQFMIEETHKRNMEFHAWLNPYRANFNINTASIASNHITRLHPEWFLTYGDKKYFDPANKDAQEFVIKVVQDIVKRYSVDAIHMDDYFYPYRIAGKEFPDEATYRRSGSGLSKDDWRRSNVDSIIKQLAIAIKKENPHCKFGISPFSVWRNKDRDPNGSDSKAGQTNYDDLYANILLWLQKGWIDYVAPQLYLEIGHDKIAYEKLLDWWGRHSYGRHIYIGHGIYRVSEKAAAWKNPNELPNQIKLLRQNPNIQGSIYFSSKSFDANPNGWNDSLQRNYYRTTALIPPMQWLEKSTGVAVTEAPVKPASVKQGLPKPDSLRIVPADGNPGAAYALTASTTESLASVQTMLVYISCDREEILKKSAGARKFIANNNGGNMITFNGFYPALFCQGSEQYFVATSFRGSDGKESGISQIVTVTRDKNGNYTFH